ncbi:unnamed protein product [Schistosoma rodhaini]|uniref:RNA helicase n=1 Tax=Schistosoma mansoni TaxID=6183 RepID=A0A3Q0KQD4_SCHMA|nr:unnamed protein product [Schistosoma rodhaini]
MNRVILSQHKITLHSSRHTLTKISRSYQFGGNSKNSGFSQPPGYIPPHIWMKLRPGREELKTSIFGVDEKKPTVDEKSYLSYASHASLSGFPVKENFSYEIVNNINEIPKVDQKLLNNLQAMGLFELTPVQKHAIGILSLDEYEKVDVKIDESNQSTDDNPPYERVTGKFDLMATAQTGSGKTLAYLIPTFNRLLRVYPFEAMQSLLISRTLRQYPSSVILVPTRELVQQILLELHKLCNQTFVRPVGVFGGERPERQMFELNKGCHFIVATPGRLLDFLKRDCISLKFCRSLILDEADRMLDMGFEEQIRQILESPKFQMPPPTGNCRQTALFSATYPREVTLLAKDFLRGPNCISLTLSSAESNTGTIVPTWGKAIRNKKEDEFDRLTRIIPKEINQQFQVVVGNPETAVPNHLLQLILEMNSKSLDLCGESVCRVLVFCNTKREVDQIDNYLYSNGVRSTSIHGDKNQYSRAKSLDLFRKGTANVLIASSVAARGIDIPNVFAVINIGLPNELDDYVHRIGRTGRMGKSGEAITLIHETLLKQQPSSRTVSRGICQLFESVGNLDKVPKLLLEYANMEIQEGEEEKYNIRSRNKNIYSKFKPRSFTKGYKNYPKDDSLMRYL